MPPLTTDITLARLAANIYRDTDFDYSGFRLVGDGLIIDEKTSTKARGLP